MTQAQIEAVFPQLILVCGTILGAAIVLISTILNSWFNQRTTRIASKEERNRTRLETIYATLIEIESIHNARYFSVIKRIKLGKSIEIESAEGIPPIKKLKMLVDLYYPNLKSSYLSFEQKKQGFFQEFTSLMIQPSLSLSEDEKQKILVEISTRWKEVISEIKNMQDEVCKQIKA
jgi:hypothetical protein